MSGFSNPLNAGEVLILDSLHSPDFIHDVSGWSLNKDGSAEFNDLTVRGTVIVESGEAVLIYAGVPAAGTLIASLAGTAGVDAFGNTYASGLTLFDAATSQIIFNSSGVTAFDPLIAMQGSAQLVIRGPAQNVGGITSILFSINGSNQGVMQIAANGGITIVGGLTLTSGGLAIASGNTFALGNGPVGKYLDGEWNLNANQAGPGVANTYQAINWTNNRVLNSDYGNPVAGTVFTVPATGSYRMNVSVYLGAGVVGQHQIRVRKSNVTAAVLWEQKTDVSSAGTLTYVTLSTELALTSGDTIVFEFASTIAATTFTVSAAGASQRGGTTLHIARSL